MAHEMHINLKFLKWRKHLSMKTVMMDHVMDTQFELQYKVRLQSLNKALLSCLMATSIVSVVWWYSWVHESLRQHGQGKHMVNILRLSMSITTMEGEIVDINVRLNQVVRQQFSRTSSGIALNFLRNFQMPGLLLQD